MKMIALLVACMSLLTQPIIKAPAAISNAERCGMTEDEFVLISSVVEAESDRSESMDGRVLIALTILNRVEDPRFPDTITGVLTQSGQFSTVQNGHSIVERTDLSDEAVIEAVELMDEDHPEVLFFNCIGYNIGQPYGYVDGNYFMLLEGGNE